MTDEEYERIGILRGDMNRALLARRYEDARDLLLVIADAEETAGDARDALLARIAARRLQVFLWARGRLEDVELVDVHPERMNTFEPRAEIRRFWINRERHEDMIWVEVDRRGRVRRMVR